METGQSDSAVDLQVECVDIDRPASISSSYRLLYFIWGICFSPVVGSPGKSDNSDNLFFFKDSKEVPGAAFGQILPVGII